MKGRVEVWVRVWCGLYGAVGEEGATCDESRVRQPITLITECHSCSRSSTECGLRGGKGGSGRRKGRRAWWGPASASGARSAGPPQGQSAAQLLREAWQEVAALPRWD